MKVWIKIIILNLQCRILCAYADVYDMLSLTETMVREVFYSIKKSYKINFNQCEISLENKFDVLDFFESIYKFSKTDISQMRSSDLYEFLMIQM